MIIRQLTTADIPELRELAIRIYTAAFGAQNTPKNLEAFIESDYSIEAFRRDFEDPTSRYYFAIEDGKTAGYLRVRSNKEVDHLIGTNNLELHRLYVDPEFHGKKIADELMRYAIRIAENENREWIWLGVWEHNPRAQRFYQKWGFEKFSEHVFQMGEDAQTDWLLKRKVAGGK